MTTPEEPTPGQRLAEFLGYGDDETFLPIAEEAVTLVTAMVKAYTRGRGFTDDTPDDALSAVVRTASARLAVNPGQMTRESVDGGGAAGFTPFVGFTLAELIVLNGYRVRWA